MSLCPSSLPENGRNFRKHLRMVGSRRMKVQSKSFSISACMYVWCSVHFHALMICSVYHHNIGIEVHENLFVLYACSNSTVHVYRNIVLAYFYESDLIKTLFLKLMVIGSVYTGVVTGVCVCQCVSVAVTVHSHLL